VSLVILAAVTDSTRASVTAVVTEQACNKQQTTSKKYGRKKAIFELGEAVTEYPDEPQKCDSGKWDKLQR
jgi:hypothetical protein